MMTMKLHLARLWHNHLQAPARNVRSTPQLVQHRHLSPELFSVHTLQFAASIQSGTVDTVHHNLTLSLSATFLHVNRRLSQGA